MAKVPDINVNLSIKYPMLLTLEEEQIQDIYETYNMRVILYEGTRETIAQEAPEELEEHDSVIEMAKGIRDKMNSLLHQHKGLL